MYINCFFHIVLGQRKDQKNFSLHFGEHNIIVLLPALCILGCSIINVLWLALRAGRPHM